MKTGFMVLVYGLSLASTGAAQNRPQPTVVATIAGEDVYDVLPLGAIPAIDRPSFLTGKAGNDQMRADEPVLGVVIDGQARAYSLWQLDAHEIVNDRLAGTAIAATW